MYVRHGTDTAPASGNSHGIPNTAGTLLGYAKVSTPALALRVCPAPPRRSLSVNIYRWWRFVFEEVYYENSWQCGQSAT